jgi:lipid II:glycine glycyltransferase (peptidoglycan interpeptide bridge formation enzyme)
MLKKNNFREISKEEWNLYWSAIEATSLFQSWEYGDAKADVEGWNPVRFAYQEPGQKVIAILQILTKSYPLIGGIARLNRGPLFLDTGISIEKKNTVMQNLAKLAKNNRWWILFIAPELEDKEFSPNKMKNIGFRYRRKVAPYGSSRLFLGEDEDVLMSSLKGKWRNMLKKSLKSGIDIKHYNGNSCNILKIIDRYKSFQKDKGFSGVSSELLLRLSKEEESKQWRFCYLCAITNKNKILGELVSIEHGSSATYFIGMTNYSEKSLNVNYALIWHSLLIAKSNGCKYYDTGGINQNTTDGIARFKKGLNGYEYSLIGEYYLSWLKR